MPKFSARSRANLDQCHPDLIKVAELAIETIDFSVICGHRDEASQNLAFASGHSKARWPLSKHNALPSLAFDFAPFPLDWKNENSFYRVIGVLQASARRLNIKIKFGADFRTLRDLPHVELV